jgi:hypothetical protein
MPQKLRTSKAATESPSSSSSDDDGDGHLDPAVLKKLQQRRARAKGCDAASLLGSNIDTKVKATEEGLSMGHFSSQTSDVSLNPLMAQYIERGLEERGLKPKAAVAEVKELTESEKLYIVPENLKELQRLGRHAVARKNDEDKVAFHTGLEIAEVDVGKAAKQRNARDTVAATSDSAAIAQSEEFAASAVLPLGVASTMKRKIIDGGASDDRVLQQYKARAGSGPRGGK